MSVIAAIPASLEGRAKKWFRSHTMSRERMRSIDGWTEALTEEFKVNTAIARERARLRKYTPSQDDSVDDYYYDKLELVRAAEADITLRRTVEELWLGLPPDFQALLDYDEMTAKSVSNFGHSLRTKDLSYRAMLGRRRQESREVVKDINGRNFHKKQDDLHRSERFNRRDNSSKGKGDGKPKDFRSEKRSKDKEKDLPPNLPKEKWRKNEKGKTMKRKYRFCQK